jgi:acetyl esterase/lipase
MKGWSLDRRDQLIMTVLLVAVVGGATWGLIDAAGNTRTAPRDQAANGSLEGLRLIEPTIEEYKPGLHADVYRPRGRGPFAAVMLIHGGGFQVGGRSDLGSAALRLANRGVLAATIDYTLVGRFEPASVDVTDAYQWLVGRDDVDPERVALLGTSAGATLSAWLGFGTNTPRALVLVATPGYFPERVTRRGPETLLVHGTDDQSVPVQSSSDFSDFLTQKGVAHDLVIGRGVGHFDALAREWDAVEAWLVPRLQDQRRT